MLLPQRKNHACIQQTTAATAFTSSRSVAFNVAKHSRTPRDVVGFWRPIQSEAATKNFSVPAYCIMPDHCHLLLQGLDESSDFLRLMKSLKIKTSRRFCQDERQQLWQHAYFEHILLRPEEIQSVAWYIWLNPVRKGIANQPEAYEYAGSLTGLKMPSAWAKLDWKPEWK
jgi:REP element-mobilizing transposase RayT